MLRPLAICMLAAALAGDAYEVIFMAPGEATVAGRTIVAKEPMHKSVGARP
jgi:hypothetical protein